ncbi:MAG: PH domain-containing protein [Clostridiales bacterium]|jgi:uncharacterized membrane protein YdbT with pleckstrin-like domain|nr:PH domain-containing protein [Clostridiales bacterium]
MNNLNRIHPYAVWEYISRWALLLLIPLSQQLLMRPENLWEQIRLASVQLMLLAGFFVLSAAQRRATGYRSDEQALLYQRGLFFQRQMRIPYRCFDSVTVKQTLAPALFGAARLFLDTPAGGKKHADVGLTLSRKYLWRTAVAVYPICRQELLYRAGAWRILLMSAFWSNPGTGLLLVAPFIKRMGDVLGAEISERLYSTVDLSLQLAAWGIPPVSAALAYLLFAGWVIALLVQLFRYGNFKLFRCNDLLTIRRGLVNSSQRMFRSSRVSALSIRQTLLMRMFRLYSGYVHNIGSGKDKGDRSMLVAAASHQELACLLQRAVPGLPTRHKEPIRPPKGTVKSYLLTPLWFAAGFFAVTLSPYLFGSYSRLFSLVSVFAAPFFCWWCALRFAAQRTAGLSREQEALLISGYRRLTLYFASIPWDRVQMVSISQSPFQRRSRRCNVRVHLYSESSESFVVKHLEIQAVRELLGENHSALRE